MKSADKIGYVTFCISLAAVAVSLLLFPVFIVFPGLVRAIIAHNGMNPYNMAIWLIYTGAAVNWFYCIWYLLKYDRYSFSIIPLFLLGIFYSPFYYYRVIIKKRPLRNTIGRNNDEYNHGNRINEEPPAKGNDN